ncbi:MAG: hypothetical protein AMJ69_10470 [Gammaproteobacteria bacterium SG8_47]|nr:MAG: hypothetical protein AMJ69_10470 [Gammaproteobacteria bacterium SG8_47]
MTPAITAAKRAAIEFHVHEYAHDPSVSAYADEAATALGLDPSRVFKTLVVTLNADSKRLAVAIVPAAQRLDLKALATELDAKKAEMALPADAERATGYVVGGISPLAQRKRLPTVLDQSAERFETIFVSAGRRGLEIELRPEDLVRLCAAQIGPVARER